MNMSSKRPMGCIVSDSLRASAPAMLSAALLMVAGMSQLALAKPAKATKAKPSATSTAAVVDTLGTSPRKVRKYKFTPKTQVAFTMETVTDVAMGGAITNKVVVPTMLMGGETTVLSVTPSGDASMSQVITMIDAKDRPGAAMTGAMLAEQLKDFEGFKVTLVASPSGAASNIVFSNAEAIPAQFQGMLSDMAQSMQNFPVFPAAAIGVGATWKMVQPITSGGAKMEGRHTFELTAVDGDVVTITDRVTIVGLAQKIVAHGQTVDLKSVTGGGESHIKINLTTLEMSLDGSTSVEADMGIMKVKTSMQIKFYPTKP